jgi:hypothetical protein
MREKGALERLQADFELMQNNGLVENHPLTTRFESNLEQLIRLSQIENLIKSLPENFKLIDSDDYLEFEQWKKNLPKSILE